LAQELRSHGGRRQPREVRRAPDAPLTPSQETPLVPRWDRDRRELYIGASLVKRFKIPSQCQESILAAFEENNWAQRIDDPLIVRAGQTRSDCLKESIESLNRSQRQPRIRFLQVAESGQVAWELCDQRASALGVV
jgi:hypothetical protein